MSISSSKTDGDNSSHIVKVTSINLVVPANIHKLVTWREAFTNAVSDPIGTFLGEVEKLHILQNVSLEIRKGERAGLIGVNGSGKTSLCRCIVGMYPPTHGTVEIKGSNRAIFDTTIGIQPELTGRENGELLSRFMYPDAEDLDALIEEALTFSELGQFLDIPYKLYSKGMQARLCLALVSARPCDFLVLDEVFDGADIFFSEKIANRLLNLIRSSGSVLFVSHSIDQIRKVCNRVLVMDKGKIRFDGNVEEGIAFYSTLGASSHAPGAAISKD